MGPQRPGIRKKQQRQDKAVVPEDTQKTVRHDHTLMPREQRLVVTVSELTRHIKDCLEPVYQDIWVEGEVSNLRFPASGHAYFILKDDASQLRAVMFRLQVRALRCALSDGLRVMCRGRISVYEPRGEYQLLVDIMEPRGMGDLQLAFEQLKARLNQEGLFDPGHKKPLPYLPRRIALITSPTGAAVRDLIHVILRRFPNMALTIVPVKVQGEDAPEEIAAALKLANALELADVLIVARGGGSIEDLWAFNTEQVARAIYASRIPVISAVGHEIDYTIADFVADLRAPTPSAAAELVVREKRLLLQALVQLQQRLIGNLRQHARRYRTALRHCRSRLPSPARKIADRRLRLDDVHLALGRSLPAVLRQRAATVRHAYQILHAQAPLRALLHAQTRTQHLCSSLAQLARAQHAAHRARLHSILAQLHAYSPLQVLARGYSITRTLPARHLVREAGQVQPGDSVTVRLGKGALDCLVTKIRD